MSERERGPIPEYTKQRNRIIRGTDGREHTTLKDTGGRARRYDVGGATERGERATSVAALEKNTLKEEDKGLTRVLF